MKILLLGMLRTPVTLVMRRIDIHVLNKNIL